MAKILRQKYSMCFALVVLLFSFKQKDATIKLGVYECQLDYSNYTILELYSKNTFEFSHNRSYGCNAYRVKGKWIVHRNILILKGVSERKIIVKQYQIKGDTLCPIENLKYDICNLPCVIYKSKP